MHKTSETIKTETQTPESCFIIEQNRFEEINGNPQKYSEFISFLEMEIFENEPLSTEDEMEFVAQIDYAINLAAAKKEESKLPSTFLDKQIIVKQKDGNIYVLVMKRTSFTVPCRQY